MFSLFARRQFRYFWVMRPLVTCLALLLAFANPLAAQQPVTSPAPAARAFDPAATSLGPNFQPDDFAAVYKSLSIPPKDEFETTAQYDARRQKVATGIRAFAVSPMGPAPYNADAGRFEIPAVCWSFRRRRPAAAHIRPRTRSARPSTSTSRPHSSPAFSFRRRSRCCSFRCRSHPRKRAT
jgi:hypothetical protein